MDGLTDADRTSERTGRRRQPEGLLLDVSGSSRLAAYEGGLLLGAQGASGASLTRLDAAGVAVGDAAEVPAGLPDQDFEGRADGEVAWATASGGALSVARVRICE